MGVGRDRCITVNMEWLERVIKEEEVRKAVECCAGDKAPNQMYSLSLFAFPQ